MLARKVNITQRSLRFVKSEHLESSVGWREDTASDLIWFVLVCSSANHHIAYICQNQTILSIDIFSTLSLVFIDVSNCNIKQIFFSVHIHTFHQKILFGNFSVNLIKDTTFFQANFFKNFFVVDISNNLISVLVFKDSRMKHLIFIYVQHNPILFIDLSNGMDSIILWNILIYNMLNSNGQ